MKEQALETMEKWHQKALNGTKTVAKTADHYVHDNPWTSVAIAATIGCMIGWALGRVRR